MYKTRNYMLIAVVAGLSACGGGGGYSPVNRAPQIQGLTDQSISQDTTLGPLSFTVSDSDTNADQIVVTASSSDSTLVPSDGIRIAGSGASRTLQVTPTADAFGTVNIQLKATDPAGNASTTTVRVQVNAVYASFLGTAVTAFGTDENGDLRPVSGLTFTPDADDMPTAFDTLLQ